jgi:hypothetical protein
MKGKIETTTPKPQLFRKNDFYLMDSAHLNEFSIREKIYIHRCQLHLQVETLSDISTASGSHIHKAWIQNLKDKPSLATTRWPRQDPPGNMAWAAWKKVLRKISNNDGKLRYSLGRLIQPNSIRQFQAYITLDNKLRLRNELGKWDLLELEKTLRKLRTHLLWKSHPTHKPSTLDTPTDVLNFSSSRVTVANPAQWIACQTTAAKKSPKWYETAETNTSHLIGNISMIMPDEDIRVLLQ